MKMKKTGSPITFCLDIGGSGIKGFTADAADRPTCERVRLETPHPATPEAMLAVIKEIVGEMPHFDRVAAGFPGVVVKGRTLTAPNLDPAWEGFDLAKALEKLTGKPARVANDAGVQGLAAIEGTGTELVLTLGTGMGFALYVDGHYVPNIEMAHHPFRQEEDLRGAGGQRGPGKRRQEALEPPGEESHPATGADLQLPRPLSRRRQRQGDRLQAAGQREAHRERRRAPGRRQALAAAGVGNRPVT